MMENHRKHTLGHRAFLFFLAGRIKFTLFLFILAGALWYSERWISAADIVFWVNYAAGVVALAAATLLLVMLFYTWLEYRCYTYLFTPEAFVVNQGYILRNEVATLYHQIQNVNIQRRPLDRLMGVSTIVIMLAGGQHDDAARSTITLPGLGKMKARLVQKELLVRARRHAGGRTNGGGIASAEEGEETASYAGR